MARRRKKRIFNPVTGRYYRVRLRTTSYSRRGQITGLWSSKKKRKKKWWW